MSWVPDPRGGVEVPIWTPRKELSCRETELRRAAAAARELEEYNRELYVALTRAEDRVVVCGHATRRPLPDESWYELVRRGMQRLPDVEEGPVAPFEGAGPVLLFESRQVATPETKPVGRDLAASSALPEWFGQPLAEELRLAQPLAPSQPQDAELGPVPFAASPLAAREAAGLRLKRGQMLHTLLQHLPALPREARAEAARAFLARPGALVTPGQAEMLAEEVVGILDNESLAPLFGPQSRAEVPLTGVVGNSIVGGLVDRLAVLADRVLVADYKTNREPPVRIEETPVLYLRQMAAYRAVLRGVFPKRAVACALIWTQAGRVAWLPDALLDPHAPKAA